MPGSRHLARFNRSLLGRFTAKYLADRAHNWAAVIAYSALFAMFPILLMIATIVGLLLRDPGTATALLDGLRQALPPGEASRDVIDALLQSERNAGLLAIVSFLGLFWSGSSLFAAMEDGFNVAYNIADRSMVASRLMGVVMIFVFAVLVPVTIGTSSLATFLVGLSEDALPVSLPAGKLVTTAFGYLISVGSAFIMFLAVFWVVPNRRFRFGQVWLGALVAAVLFVLASQVFPLYVATIAGFNRYGATFGLFFLLMTWFYLLGQILVVGVEINALCSPVSPSAVSATRPVEPLPVIVATRPRPTRPPARRRFPTPVILGVGVVIGLAVGRLHR